MRIRNCFFILMMLFFSFPHIKADRYSPVQPSCGEPVGTYHALIIGIDNYRNSSDELSNLANSGDSLECNGVFPDLEESVHTAKEIKSILVRFYCFEENNVKMLTGEDGTDTPTRNNIMKYFAEFVSRLKDTDSLLVFFSGHGCFESRLGVGYWIASDGLKISGEEIRSICKSAARHVFIVSDSCYSSQIFPDVISEDIDFPDRETESYWEGIRQKEKLKSRQVLASGEKKVPAGRKDNFSPFCQAFLEGLKENPDRMVDAQSIINVVKEKLEPQRKGNTQSKPVGGRVFLDEDRGGQFVFRRKYSEREEEIAQIYGRIYNNYKQLKIDLDDSQKELTRLTDNAPQSDSPVIEYYREKAKELHETIRSIGYLKKEYHERMEGISVVNTVLQMETLDSLLTFVDNNSNIKIKQNDEVKEIIEKIRSDKEMLLNYVRAYKKSDYKSFVEKYENKSPSRLSHALVEKAHEALEPMKMSHWFVDLEASFIGTDVDISFMRDEYDGTISLSLGYFIEGKIIKMIPFFRIGKSPVSSTEDEFGTVNEFILSAQFKPFVTLSTGIEIPIRWSENTFLFFTASHTFHFLRPNSFWEKNLGVLKFRKNNKVIGLSTIDLGMGINFSLSNEQPKKKKQSILKSIGDRLAIVFSFDWSTPIKTLIEYKIEISDKLNVIVPYRLKKSFFSFGLSFRLWIGERT